MASTKKYDVAVKVGTYESGGQTKNRYKNVGVVMEGDNGLYMLLERTFNPAGVPGSDGRDTVLLSFFEPKDNAGAAPAQGQQRRQAPAAAPAAQKQAPAGDMDDDIPF